MSALYLLDPWFVQLKPADPPENRFSRLYALSKVEELQNKYRMTPGRFIDEEFLLAFKNNYLNYQRADGRDLGKIISELVLEDEHVGQAEISDSPCPNFLPSAWLQALDYYGCDFAAPNWRRPMIIISETRSETWPRVNEIGFKTSGCNQITNRILVHIEKYDQHDYCEPDLDPWRLGAIGEPLQGTTGAITERRHSLKRLPRPLHILPLNTTFDEMKQILLQRINLSCGHSNRAYYVPPKDWDPRTISRDDWRSGNVFPTDLAQDGRRGRIDREGYIWLWDQLHNDHWDVQIPSGGHLNVSHDGAIRR